MRPKRETLTHNPLGQKLPLHGDQSGAAEPKYVFEQEVHCSFCGKAKDDAQLIVAGPHVYICDQCVLLCVEILEEQGISVHHSEGLQEIDVSQFAQVK